MAREDRAIARVHGSRDWEIVRDRRIQRSRDQEIGDRRSRVLVERHGCGAYTRTIGPQVL